ncbi:MAG: hypothetical protein CL677_01455 [Bdellovibrionaceae bacterium]|nr:hypothetical protein [Pseudobdellovibrionaceae bacterium]|tara:strand:- start:146277 stop:147011 length:735 start_codon:yes stop_codon:yes gene_type:complete
MATKFYFFAFIFFLLTGCSHGDWRTASRDSVGIAPKPSEEQSAVVQVYAARTFNWHKYLAVHSWIAFKEKGADTYQVYHVLGWSARRGGPAVVGSEDLPDRQWYGNDPDLITDLRGEIAERAIPKIKAAIASYPYQRFYRLYPGPNSNTFISHVIRNVDELQVELPPTAVGKDWINDGDFVGFSESGTGVQLSLYGMFGLTLGLGEGIEVNLLGLNFGVDILRPALKMPLIGRIGFSDAPVFGD